MPTPMDRGFGDDGFRKMQRMKMARDAGLPLPEQSDDIEEPIVSSE